MTNDQYIFKLLTRIAIAFTLILFVVIGIVVVVLLTGLNPIILKIEIGLPNVFVSIKEMATSFDCWLQSIIEGNEMLPIMLAFVPGILGISYPLIIQTIGNLNAQYRSTHLVAAFKSEQVHKWFLNSLKTSTVLSILCFSKSTFFIVLAFAASIILLIMFFRYMSLLLKYQSGDTLFKHFLKRFKTDRLDELFSKSRNIAEEKALVLEAWHSIIDLFIYSIANNDLRLQSDIKSLFIYRAFNYIKYVEQPDKETIEFPDEFYNSSFEIVATFIGNKDENRYQQFESFVGSLFFVEGFSNENQIQNYHLKTFTAIWRNLVLLVENSRGDKILRYWGAAHQHCSYIFSIQPREFDTNHEETDKSKMFRKKLLLLRNSFIQFHSVLGAYLMYKQDYKTLRETWFYTQSQPPSWVLVPRTLTEIFNLYFAFLDDFGFSSNFTIAYWFKDLEFDAMNDTQDVKSIVRRYACLLFLKQWITPDPYGFNQITLPNIPSGQGEKLRWSDNLSFFKTIVANHLTDPILCQKLGLDRITPEECSKRDIPFPLNYLDNLKQTLLGSFEQALNDQELDVTKTEALDKYTIETLQRTYHSLLRISGSDVSPSERDAQSDRMVLIRGSRILLEKESLVANSSISYIHYEKRIAGVIKQEYYNHISIKFYANTTEKYKVPSGKLFEAVKRLALKADEHVIVAFKVNIEYLKEYNGVEIDPRVGKEDFNFKSIPIFCFYDGMPSVYNTIFVLRKIDLPMIKHKSWKEVENLEDGPKKYWESMGDPIDDSLKLYRKITELNKDYELLSKYIEQGKEESELRKMVEVKVDFLGYFWFKRGIKMISIREEGMFIEGSKNGLDEKIPF